MRRMPTLRWFNLIAFCLMPASPLFAGGLDTNATKALVSGNTAFASDLFMRLRTNQGNLF